MDIRPVTSVPSTSSITESVSQCENTGAEGVKRIRQSCATSGSSDNTSLVERSVIQTKTITPDELADLILEQRFVDHVHYQVEGDFIFRAFTEVTAFPKNLSVKGRLDLHGCTGLRVLSGNLSVGGIFDLIGCTSLTALPDNLSVGRDFLLINCTSLTALPENLSVGGSLILTSCTSLTALPEELSVGRSLILESCTSLTALPEELSVGGSLSLWGCTSLRTLPEQITTMGPVSRREPRHVNLENTGLSNDLIDRLSNTPAPGMRFLFSRSGWQSEQTFSTLKQGLEFWSGLLSSYSDRPDMKGLHNQAAKLIHSLPLDQTNDLVLYLKGLTGTKDYENQATRLVLARRVMAFMSLLTENESIRGEVLQRIHDALSSCGDRVILALDDIETLQALKSAETLALQSGDPTELRALGQKMMRLDEVKKIARSHMQTLKWVDEIEVELAFQIGVRQQVDLPGSTQSMIFTGCAKVSNKHIANAVKRVKRCCSKTRLEAYLKTWTPWQTFQRRQAVPAFGQLKSTAIDTIDTCALCSEKTNQMVKLGDTHLDYDALVKAYVNNGQNPFTRQPLDWSGVVRLTEKKPTDSV